MIEKEWKEEGLESEPWRRINNNLKDCQKALELWHKKTFKKVDDEIRDLKQELHGLINGGQSLRNLEEVEIIQGKIDSLWKQEELYWQ